MSKDLSIIRVPQGSNLYQLYLYNICNQQIQQVKALSPVLKTRKANQRGKQLAKELCVPYVRKINDAVTQEQAKELARIKRQAKVNKRQRWADRQEVRWNAWREHFAGEELAIALGDWDAADDYVLIAQHSTLERFLWLDNAYCSSRGTVLDRTKMALARLKEQSIGSPPRFRHKLIYKDGCKDAITFIENIKV